MNTRTISLLMIIACFGSARIESQHGCLQMPRSTQTAETESPDALQSRLEALEIEHNQPQKEAQATVQEKKENHWNESEGGHCIVS